MKRRMMMIILGVALIALPTMAQVYGTPYSGDEQKTQQVFQSTSTMQGSESSYSANPTLNENGTATYTPAQAPGKPIGRIRKDTNPFGDDENKETVGGDDPNGPGSPLGDALWPMMVLAMLCAAVMAIRRKRSALNR